MTSKKSVIRIINRVIVPWYRLRDEPTLFVEVVTSIFNPANTTLYHLGEGDFAERVWDVTINLRSETSLERLKNFTNFAVSGSEPDLASMS